MDMQKAPFEEAPAVLEMARPCTCTSFCLNRPFITVNYVENGKNIYLGKISDPYNACNLLYMVHDKTNNPVYKIQTCCVQGGVLCRGCPCGPCERVSLGVTDVRSGAPLPPITKFNPTCIKDFMKNSDHFSMEFPGNSSWEERSLLLGTIIFIDFMSFEEKGGS
jgi:hypothetical protein